VPVKECLMDSDVFLTCPVCAEIRLFEIPPCPDGHGADCSDRVCTACGLGLFGGPDPEAAAADRPVALPRVA
jgi:hypothetical protein